MIDYQKHDTNELIELRYSKDCYKELPIGENAVYNKFLYIYATHTYSIYGLKILFAKIIFSKLFRWACFQFSEKCPAYFYNKVFIVHSFF